MHIQRISPDLLEIGLERATIRLDECQSPEEVTELVRERAGLTPPGGGMGA